MQKEINKRITFRISGKIISLIGLVIFLLDQYCKFYFRNNPESKINVLRDFKFEYYTNQGIAFSIGIPPAITLVLVVVILAALIWFFILKKKEHKSLEISVITLIILGAASNLIDRLAFGHVIDYISIYYYPVFNLADALVVIGAALWFVIMVRESKKDI